MGPRSKPVVVCIQNSVISSRTTCVYGSQSLSVAFACKTATFGAELKVCMGPRPHLSFCACKSAWLAPELLVSIGPRRDLSFCACKTAWLEPDFLVSICPRLHLWYCACKTECLASELLVPMGPVLICCFCMQNNDFCTRITSIYGSQTWPVDLCMQKKRDYHQNY